MLISSQFLLCIIKTYCTDLLCEIQSCHLFAKVTKHKNDFAINREKKAFIKMTLDNDFSFWLSQVMMRLSSKLFRFCWCLDWQVVHITFILNLCIPFRRIFKVSTTFCSPVSLCDTGRTDLTPETFICLWLRPGEKHCVWRIRAVHVGNCAATSCLHEDGHFFIFLLHTSPILVWMTGIWRVTVGLWEAWASPYQQTHTVETADTFRSQLFPQV